MLKTRVAITIREDLPLHQLLYGNGIAQNTKFLYDLLEKIGFDPFFLVFTNQPAHNFTFVNKCYQAISFQQVLENKLYIPVVLEIGVTLNPEHRAPLREYCQSKIVSVRYGNSMIMDVQEMTLANNRLEGLLHVAGSDALWISPHFSRSKSYLETIYQCEAHYCPYIWEPDFISDDVPESPVGLVPDIYVMEPNIDVMKTAMIPLCIVSRLYQQAPDSFGKAYILNSEGFKEKAFFLENIIRNLPGTSDRHPKVFFTGRYTFDEVFKRRDILLGHQWECELNYLYLEALYKGITLVHNSPFLKEVGFYYGDCEVTEGVNACMKAIEEQKFQKSHKNNRDFLHQFSIENTNVQHTYSNLLSDLIH